MLLSAPSLTLNCKTHAYYLRGGFPQTPKSWPKSFNYCFSWILCMEKREESIGILPKKCIYLCLYQSRWFRWTRMCWSVVKKIFFCCYIKCFSFHKIKKSYIFNKLIREKSICLFVFFVVLFIIFKRILKLNLNIKGTT